MRGWIEVDPKSFWAHYGASKTTYVTIARIFSKKYHVRYYTNHKDKDIGTRSTLTEAKQLAESTLHGGLHHVL
jgi:hypothetical protein